MKKILFVLLALFFTKTAYNQDDTKLMLTRMNQCISGFSADASSPLNYFPVSGMLEQKQQNLSQRITLSDVTKVIVEISKVGYSVTYTCNDEGNCVSLIKSDMSTSTMASTSFFFNNPAAANTFATMSNSLISKSRKVDKPIDLILFKTQDGQTPLLPETTYTTTEKKQTQANKKAEEDQDEEYVPITKPASNKKTTKRDEEEDVEDKPIKEPKSTTKKKQQKEDKEDNDTESEPVKEKKSKPKKTEPELNEPENDTDKKLANDFCGQLMAVVKSGTLTKFKDIEGKETNAEKKVNESKLKLKGAKKNYLSWFNQERAFISELKSVLDNDLAIEEFEKLQAQLDECLADGWDFNDRSQDENYDNAKFDVKDVEYINTKDTNSPSVRIAIAPDGDRFTLFVRVK
jgi:hypothetical protein